MTLHAPQRRFTDDGRSALDWLGIVLVRCPRCSGCATVTALPSEEPLPPGELWSMNTPRRLSCTQCYQQATEGSPLWRTTSEPADPFFRLPLFLQMPTRLGVLWAYNAEHLDWLEDFVCAELRGRKAGPHGWMNGSLASRLPVWIKLAKNRDTVLHAISRLREKLAEG